jgi:hypothetical protein
MFFPPWDQMGKRNPALRGTKKVESPFILRKPFLSLAFRAL